MIKYYDTYEEAAAVEGCEEVLFNNNKKSKMYLKFKPARETGEVYRDMDGHMFTMGFDAWIIATPPAPKKIKFEHEVIGVSSFFELAESFKSGELYFDAMGYPDCKRKIETELHLSQLYFQGYKIYRRIEKSVKWYDDLDALSYPIPLIHSDGEIATWTKDEIKREGVIRTSHNWIPATREEVQQLLNNVWEG